MDGYERLISSEAPFIEQDAPRRIERMPTFEPPNVRLQLHNQPENVSLVRTILTGVAETIDLPPATLDDITTAVTEAANNVVLHAYQGGHGPLEVDIHIAEGLITVVVRDEGVGIDIPGQTPALEESILGLGGIDEGSLKLGLPVIQALAARVELDKRASGGTEVRMEFATPETRPL
jgi:serine/threonine-protein kinase RsbW